MTVGIAYNNIKTLADIKDAVSSPAVKSRGNQIGSYTIIFNNNQKYHGKGPLPRMMLSAAQHSIANKVMVKSMQWTPSATDRQAFKDEYRRMQTDAVLPNLKTIFLIVPVFGEDYNGIFRVYGHGGYGSIWDGEVAVHSAEKFDTLMNSRNANWKNVDKRSTFNIICL